MLHRWIETSLDLRQRISTKYHLYARLETITTGMKVFRPFQRGSTPCAHSPSKYQIVINNRSADHADYVRVHAADYHNSSACCLDFLGLFLFKIAIRKSAFSRSLLLVTRKEPLWLPTTKGQLPRRTRTALPLTLFSSGPQASAGLAITNEKLELTCGTLVPKWASRYSTGSSLAFKLMGLPSAEDTTIVPPSIQITFMKLVRSECGSWRDEWRPSFSFAICLRSS